MNSLTILLLIKQIKIKTNTLLKNMMTMKMKIISLSIIVIVKKKNNNYNKNRKKIQEINYLKRKTTMKKSLSSQHLVSIEKRLMKGKKREIIAKEMILLKVNRLISSLTPRVHYLTISGISSRK